MFVSIIQLLLSFKKRTHSDAALEPIPCINPQYNHNKAYKTSTPLPISPINLFLVKMKCESKKEKSGYKRIISEKGKKTCF
jgi:hypothetical protein